MTEGEVSTIEIQRKEGENLGISVVGGCDTPLVRFICEREREGKSFLVLVNFEFVIVWHKVLFDLACKMNDCKQILSVVFSPK